jgi:V8-like Glu-specific endopeptidase
VHEPVSSIDGESLKPELRRSTVPPSGAIAFALGLAAMSVGTVGCATPKPKDVVRPAADHRATVRVAPPFALANAEDAIVRIVLPNMTCTGTAVDEDLILTAHHCVVKRGPKGEFLSENVDASAVRVELGGDYFAWGDVKAKAIVAPPCGAKGGAGDVAVLVLERKLVGLRTLQPRLDAPPRIGEEVDPIGFGRCATSGDAIRRKLREGGAIRSTNGETFFMEASVCPGDSGGPVMTRGSHQVVGVVSLSAMDGDERTKAPSIMARIDAYRKVFAQARQIADGASRAELPPLSCE